MFVFILGRKLKGDRITTVKLMDQCFVAPGNQKINQITGIKFKDFGSVMIYLCKKWLKKKNYPKSAKDLEMKMRN